MTVGSEHTVYVAVGGLYSDQRICGVYPTAEAAMADLHKPGWVWSRNLWHYGSDRGGGRQEWTNDQDWDDHVSIEAYTYTDESAQRLPDRIIAYWDSRDGRRIDRVDLTMKEADEIVSGAEGEETRAFLEGKRHAVTES